MSRYLRVPLQRLKVVAPDSFEWRSASRQVKVLFKDYANSVGSLPLPGPQTVDGYTILRIICLGCHSTPPTTDAVKAIVSKGTCKMLRISNPPPAMFENSHRPFNRRHQTNSGVVFPRTFRPDSVSSIDVKSNFAPKLSSPQGS